MSRLLRRLWYAIRQRRFEADLAEELEFHRAMKQQEIEERGINAKEAAFAAQRELGSPALAREDARAVWIWPWLESVWQDAVYVMRTVRRQPGFATAALLTVALGIGADTAIFSVINTVLLRPAPYPKPTQIVIFGYTYQGNWVPWASPTKFNIWRHHTAALEEVSAMRFPHVNLTGGADLNKFPLARSTQTSSRSSARRSSTVERSRPRKIAPAGLTSSSSVTDCGRPDSGATH